MGTITDYRSMILKFIGPILNYFGFHINDDGVVQKNDSNIGITLGGKHLYVPKDGADYFKSKDSPLLMPFSPFKNREHMLILSKFFCSTMSDHLRDEEDPIEYNPAGELIDIVALVKRGPKNEDKLPATFNGVIYETWCRNGEEVFGQGIDEGGNDIKAIFMALYDTLSKMTNFVERNPDFSKIFKIIERVENEKDKELLAASGEHSTNLSQIDLSESYIDEVDFSGYEEEEEEEDEIEKSTENHEKHHNYEAYEDDIYDDLEF